MIALTRTLLLITAAVLTTNLAAQGRNRGPLPLSPGDVIPNVAGFAEDGSPFELENLKGHPTVIAFGCLT